MQRLPSRLLKTTRATALILCSPYCMAQALPQNAAVSTPVYRTPLAPANDVLAFGPGLHRVNSRTGATDQWLDADTMVTAITFQPDRGCETATVFALVDGELLRFYADSGACPGV